MEEQNNLEQKEHIYNVFESFASGRKEESVEPTIESNEQPTAEATIVEPTPVVEEVKTEEVDTFDVEFRKRTNGKSWEEYNSEMAKPKYKSEYTQKLDEYIANGGDIETFHKWNSIDTGSLPDIEILKLAKHLENPELDFEDIEWEIENNFIVDEEFATEDEIRANKIKIKSELKKAKEIVEKEKEKHLAKKEIIKQENQIDENLVKQQKEWEERYLKQVDEVLKNKTTKLELGNNENEVFNYEPTKEEFSFIETTLKQPNNIFSLYAKQNGDVDLEKFKEDLTLIYALRNKDFKEKMLSTMYSTVEEKYLKAIKNPTYERKATAPIQKEVSSKEKAQLAFEKFSLGR